MSPFLSRKHSQATASYQNAFSVWLLALLAGACVIGFIGSAQSVATAGNVPREIFDGAFRSTDAADIRDDQPSDAPLPVIAEKPARPITVTMRGDTDGEEVQSVDIGNIERLVFSSDSGLLAVEGTDATAFFRIDGDTVRAIGFAKQIGAVALPDSGSFVGLPAPELKTRWLYRSEVIQVSLDNPHVTTTKRFFDPYDDDDEFEIDEKGRTLLAPLWNMDIGSVRLSPDGRFLAYCQAWFPGGASDLRFRDVSSGQLVFTDIWGHVCDSAGPALFLIEPSTHDYKTHYLVYDALTKKTLFDVTLPDDRKTGDVRMTEKGDLVCVTVDRKSYENFEIKTKVCRVEINKAGSGWRPVGIEYADVNLSMPLALSADGSRIAVPKEKTILLATKADDRWSTREIPVGTFQDIVVLSPKGDLFAYAQSDGNKVTIEKTGRVTR